jgi:hypothetical protein
VTALHVKEGLRVLSVGPGLLPLPGPISVGAPGRLCAEVFTVKYSGELHELCPAAFVACIFQRYFTPPARVPDGTAWEVVVPDTRVS